MKITREELDGLYNQQRLSATEIARRLGVPDSTVYRWMDRLGLPRRSISEALRVSLDDDEIVRLYTAGLTASEIGKQFDVSEDLVLKRLRTRGIARRSSASQPTYQRRDFSGDPVERGYLIGFRLGDLYVKPTNSSGASIEVRGDTTRVEQINLFHELFSPYGYVYISLPCASGERKVLCRLNLTFDFLLPKVDAIPDWILRAAQNGNTQPFLAFLAGYSDAEGCFCMPSNNRAYFLLQSCDVDLLRQARDMLNDCLGVLCPPLYLSRPGGYCNKHGITSRKDYWRLRINRKSSLDRLCKLLEPHLKHTKRRADMYAVWANVRARGID